MSTHWSGTKLRAMRERCNLPRATAALAVGVHDLSWARWESGQTEPRAVNLVLVTRLFSCTADDLVDDTCEPYTVAGSTKMASA